MDSAAPHPSVEAVLHRTGQTVPRPWLLKRIEAALPASGGGTLLLVGEPGSGKTVLAAQLAKAWNCLWYAAREGSTGGVVWKDARTLLISLGLQLRARYGPEIFGGPVLEVRAKLDVTKAGPGARLTGVEAGTVTLSPFRRTLIDVDIAIEELGGEAVGVRIADLRDVTESMTIPRLALEAAVEPLRRLAAQKPAERVLIIVDAIDESAEVADSIPFGAESPPNVVWILTSRDGDHLARFVEPAGGPRLVRIDLSAPECVSQAIDEGEAYTLTRLNQRPVGEWIADAPAPRPIADLARDMAQASNGNFLYLRYLLDGIESEARQRRFDLLTSPGALPRGLDGIYRYFVTDRVRGRAGAERWSEVFAPVLGTLAVARAPLRTLQLAAFARVEPLLVDEVVGAVRSFLETPAGEDAAFQFYHRSFAEFLLTQDRSRNPYPLRPAAAYHLLIADCYADRSDAGWKTENDRYALMHLPAHLREAGQIDRLARLLVSAFLTRQIAVLGLGQARSDCALAARAAALAGRDDAFLTLLERAAKIEGELLDAWQSGRFLLPLLAHQAAAVHELAATSASTFLPWSAFLPAERLLDLAAVSLAHDVLSTAARRAWPFYRPPAMGVGAAREGTGFDFPPQDEVVDFLAKLAASDAPLALTLTRRLFSDSPRLPNVSTAWRDVVRAFIAAAAAQGAPDKAHQYAQVAEATFQWLRRGGNPLGWAGLAKDLFWLLAKAVPVLTNRFDFLANAVLLASQRRIQARDSTVGADGQSGLWAALADMLLGIGQIAEAIPAGLGKGGEDLREVLNKSRRTVAGMCPPAPSPTAGDYSHRAAALGRLAYALHGGAEKGWREYAEAALAVCSLDAAMPDPPLPAVAEGLAWLRRLPEADVASRAAELIAILHLEDRVADAEREPDPAREWRRTLADAGEARARLAEERDPYSRGRLALAIARLDGSASGEIAVQPSKKPASAARSGRARGSDPELPFSDVAIEALVTTMTASPESWAIAAISHLDGLRSTARRKQLGFNDRAIAHVHRRALADAKKFDVLRRDIDAAFKTAASAKDFHECLACCLSAVVFEPELANTWYLQMQADLTPKNRGTAIASLVVLLAEHHPERLPDLGTAWAADLPPGRRGREIAGYQTTIFRRWARFAILRPDVVTQLGLAARALPDRIERELKQTAREDGESPDVTSPTKLWHFVGSMLQAAACVPLDDAPAREAVEALVTAAEHGRHAATASARDAERRQVARAILDGFVRSAGTNAVAAGPVTDAILRLFAEASRASPSGDGEGGGLSALDQEEAVSLGVAVGRCLKRAQPAWAEARFKEGLSLWETVLSGRQASSSPMDGIAQSILDVFSTLDQDFRDRRERTLFELAEALAFWCVGNPPERETLAQLQGRLGRIEDVDLRRLLLAPIANGWLDLGDIERARTLAAVADPKGLELAGFFAHAKAFVQQRISASASLPTLKSFVLDVISLATLDAESDMLHDALTSWFRLRAAEGGAAGGPEDQEADYLRQMFDWVSKNWGVAQQTRALP